MEKFPRSTFEATIGRGASTIGGGVLLGYGFRRDSRRGAVLALCGVELACRGLTGRSPYRCLRGEPQQQNLKTLLTPTKSSVQNRMGASRSCWTRGAQTRRSARSKRPTTRLRRVHIPSPRRSFNGKSAARERVESDTPRKAGGLMSRTASKAVGSLVEASRRARLGFRV